MIHRPVLLTCAFVFGCAGVAFADQTPKPLRTLTYDVGYSLTSQRDTAVSGLTGGQAHDIEIGRAAVQRGMSANDRGTLQIDVVAATQDGGLVVDATFDGREVKQAPVRVAVYADGRLAYDPERRLSPGAQRLLPLLARGLLAGHDVSPGSTWTTPALQPAKGASTFRITHWEGGRVTFTIATDVQVSGPNGYDENDDGTATYATDRLCPLAYELRIRMRRHVTPGTYETSSEQVSAKLLTDTFAKS
jgi:hypothetical protein